MIALYLAALLASSAAQTTVFVAHRTDGVQGTGSEDDPFAELSLAFSKDNGDGLKIWLLSSAAAVEFGSASCEGLRAQVVVA